MNFYLYIICENPRHPRHLRSFEIASFFNQNAIQFAEYFCLSVLLYTFVSRIQLLKIKKSCF